MKKLFICILIITLGCDAPKVKQEPIEEHELDTKLAFESLLITIADTTYKPLLEIRGRDTVIYDTIGPIRYLLQKYDEMSLDIYRYQQRIIKMQKVMETIDGIMFQKPKGNIKYYNL